MTEHKSQRIQAIEKAYNVIHVGFYDTPSHEAIDVFYQKFPRYDLGHSHYLGVGADARGPYLVNAADIEDAHYPAIPMPDGTWLVSRYRHDFQTHPSGAILDGGIAYTRYNPEFPPTHYVRIIDGQEVFCAAEPTQEGAG